MTEYPPTFCPSCGAELDDAASPRYDCPGCGRSVFHSPAVAAAVAVVDVDEARILLGERGIPPSEGRLSTPGGHVELGEEPEAGAVRELEEETGLVADAADLVLVDARNLTPLGDEASEEAKEVVCLDYAVDAAVVEGEPTAADDLTGVQWVGVEERGEVPWAFSGYEEFVAEAVDAVGGADSADH